MLTRRGLARFAAAGAAASFAAPSLAVSSGAVTVHPLTSRYVPGELAVATYLPPGYDRHRAEAYPLLLLLHGGNGSEQDLLHFKPVFDAEILAGRLPPLVIATPRARRSLYMDYKDGSQRWETSILSDVLPFLRRSEHVVQGRDRTFIGGWSMGGLGALRIAFKHPQLFAAVASLEPAVEAMLTWQGVGPGTRFWRPETVLQTMFGQPTDAGYWEANNPATIANRDPDRLLDLRIYLEVGDQDMLYLYEGVEFLHRILFDARLAHEYRLVHGAEHVGRSLGPRMANALDFIGRQISPPSWIDTDVLKLRGIMDQQKRAAGVDIQAVDPRRLREAKRP
jgi:S-formylglutathione hydrolase